MPMVTPRQMTPQEQAAQERMRAKLAKHSSPAPIPAPPPPKPKPPPLEWESPDLKATGYYSKCKRYSVCWVTVTTKTTKSTQYEAYVFVPSASWYRNLACKLPSEAAARSIAQKHADERTL